MILQHPEGADLQFDVSAAAWIEPRLMGWGGDDGTPVGSVVPTGYEAYVRILHHVYEDIGSDFVRHRWSELALQAGLEMHPAVQFERFGYESSPRLGSLNYTEATSLVDVLRDHAKSPTRCLLAVWDGYAELTGAIGELRVRQRTIRGMLGRWPRRTGYTAPPEGVASAPRVMLPARDYVLYGGSIDVVPGFGFRPGCLQTPNLWWPEDREWIVGTEIDFDSTVVACSRRCADDLLSSDLEALEVSPLVRLDLGGDTINPG